MTTNPWIGLDSYREGQILYGRSREIRDLSMAVFYNRQTIVYGRSGTGKSSLLHAGIFPEARLRGCLPISIRFDHSSDTNYREQLIRTITAAIEAAGGEVRDLLEENHLPESLWEFFHRYQFLRDGKPLTPLLVVDQFEEIFTLSHRKEDVQRFFTELGDLLNDVMPDYLQETAVTAKATDTTSIFGSMTFQSMESRYLTDPSYHLVLVLRDDYLSYLERYSQRIPALKQNRYGLMPITYQQALEIIMQPRPGLVSSEVADAIIRHIVTETDLNDETPVDAAILSLFLSRLYEKKGDNPVINLQLVNEQGEALLEDFYAEVVAPLDRNTVYYLEDILVNADGHRENVTLETLFKNDWCHRDVVETLEASHLLRLFSYGDVQRVEYAHDVLCPIIVHRKEQRENEARYRRQQNRTFWGYTAVVLTAFLALFIGIRIMIWQGEVQTKEEQFASMESSLLDKYCRLRIEDRQLYSAIRVLINTMPDDLSHPDEETAEKEKLLRQAIENLESVDYVTPSHSVLIPHSDSLRHLICVSRSEKIVAVNISQFYTANLLDAHTGELIYSYTHKDHHENEPEVNVGIMRDGIPINAFRFENQDGNIFISDISPDDSKALIIADDTTVLECFMWDIDGESTRLALHQFHKPLLTACYKEDGEWIAVMARDSTYYLFDVKHGYGCPGFEDTAKCIIERNEIRKSSLLTPKNSAIRLHDGTIYSRRGIKRDKQSFAYNGDDILSHLYKPTKKIEDKWKSYMDSIYGYYYIEIDLLDSLLRSDSVDIVEYASDIDIWDYETHAENYYLKHPELYVPNGYIYCISPDEKRIFYTTYEHDYLCGIYTETGKSFYYNEDIDANSIYFSDDNQWLIVNAGEEDQKILSMKPLPDLVEDCKKLFCHWEMSSSERFDAYKRLNRSHYYYDNGKSFPRCVIKIDGEEVLNTMSKDGE